MKEFLEIFTELYGESLGALALDAGTAVLTLVSLVLSIRLLISLCGVTSFPGTKLLLNGFIAYILFSAFGLVVFSIGFEEEWWYSLFSFLTSAAIVAGMLGLIKIVRHISTTNKTL